MAKDVNAKTWALEPDANGDRWSAGQAEANLPPVWSGAPSSLNVAAGSLVNFYQWASDPNSDVLTYSLRQTPTGYSITSAGVLTVGPGNGTVVVRATDPGGLYAETSCTITITVSTGSLWPALGTVDYLPIVPNARGHGMDTTAGSGRDASVPNSAANAGLGTTILFVDSLATTKRGGSTFGSSNNTISNGVGYGTLSWCLAKSGRGGADVSGARTVIPLVSGVIQYDPTTTAADPLYVAPNTTFAGEAAPAPGLVVFGRGPRLESSHICIRHLTVVWPGQPGYDASAFGAYGVQSYTVGDPVDAHIYANCTALWHSGMGIGINHGIGVQRGTVWQCAILQPPYLQYGPTYTLPNGISTTSVEAIGRGTRYDNLEDQISEMRTLWAHCTFRMPLTSSKRQYCADSVAYNIGLQGAGFGPGSYGGGDASGSRAHLRSMIYMDGPNTKYFGENGVCWKTGASLTGYLQGAVYFDPNNRGGRAYLDRVASVGGLMPLLYGPNRTDSAPYSTPSGIDPAGYTPRPYVAAGNYDRTLTLAQVREQVELVCSTAGSRPRTRIPEATTIINQVIAKANGATTGLGTIKGGLAYGTNDSPGVLWPLPTLAPVAANTISNPLSPGSYWGGSPCPISQRDTIAASGYTVLEEWLHVRHAEVM